MPTTGPFRARGIRFAGEHDSRSQLATLVRPPLIIAASLVFLLSLPPSVAFAKRRAPKPVPPLVHEGVEYRAPHARMGIVEAVDRASGRKLWETRVYVVL